jgi:hypothetical protein
MAKCLCSKIKIPPTPVCKTRKELNAEFKDEEEKPDEGIELLSMDTQSPKVRIIRNANVIISNK